mmetsp:Transcript_28914/g.40631  ORF Transcript_28914/g.40631 Transcript_28914/m.40631 type:complete len:98 (-) Transcript_28914:165-458(-)
MFTIGVAHIRIILSTLFAAKHFSISMVTLISMLVAWYEIATRHLYFTLYESLVFDAYVQSACNLVSGTSRAIKKSSMCCSHILNQSGDMVSSFIVFF